MLSALQKHFAVLCVEKEWGKVYWGSISPLSNKLLNIVLQDMFHHLCWLLQLGKSSVSQTFIGCVIWQAGEETTSMSVTDFVLDGAGSWEIPGTVRTAFRTETCLPVPKPPRCLFCRLWICWGFLNILYKHDSSAISKGSFWNTQKECRRKWKPFCLLLAFILSKVLILLSKHKNQQKIPEN